MKADLLITQDIVFARDAMCPTLFYEHYLIRWHIYSFQVAARDQDDASVRFLAIVMAPSVNWPWLSCNFCEKITASPFCIEERSGSLWAVAFIAVSTSELNKWSKHTINTQL